MRNYWSSYIQRKLDQDKAGTRKPWLNFKPRAKEGVRHERVVATENSWWCKEHEIFFGMPDCCSYCVSEYVNPPPKGGIVMRTIWKYELPELGTFTLDLPAGAMPISVQMQHKKPTLWVLVHSTTAETLKRKFLLTGTGHEIKESDVRFIGTFQMLDGDLVFHLFEVDGL